MDIAAVTYAFAGIRVCVCVLIFNSVLKLWKNAVKDIPALVIFLAIFFLSLLTDVSTILFVVCSGAIGFAVKAISRRMQAKKEGGEAK